MNRLEATLWASVVDSDVRRHKKISIASQGAAFMVGVIIGALLTAALFLQGAA